MEELKGAIPKFCHDKHDNLNTCTDIHWFNIHQIGKLPAREVRVGLFHFDEQENIDIEKRWDDTNTFTEKNFVQFKLPPYTIPIKYFSQTKNGSFFVLMEYSSAYSNVRYKRCYQMFFHQ